jgi:hypothetical protein
MRKPQHLLFGTTTDRPCSRALHSAGLALIGAAGFLGSAVLPPDAYKVGCDQPHLSLPCISGMLIAPPLGPLRMPYRGYNWSVLLYPTLTRMALGKLT